MLLTTNSDSLFLFTKIVMSYNTVVLVFPPVPAIITVFLEETAQYPKRLIKSTYLIPGRDVLKILLLN